MRHSKTGISRAGLCGTAHVKNTRICRHRALPTVSNCALTRPQATSSLSPRRVVLLALGSCCCLNPMIGGTEGCDRASRSAPPACVPAPRRALLRLCCASQYCTPLFFHCNRDMRFLSRRPPLRSSTAAAPGAPAGASPATASTAAPAAIEALPDALLEAIFLQLDAHTLLQRVALVSRRFRRVAEGQVGRPGGR